MSAPILNIAAYRFTPMQGLVELRRDLYERASRLSLRGTVLLAPEGINLFLAGEPGAVHEWLGHVRTLPGLGDLAVKESFSAAVPFGRLRVRLKREIIAFRKPGVSPLEYTSPRVSPQQLKAWLDAGEPVVLLDTRNDYETEHGTFEGALTLPLDDFVNLPHHLGRLPPKDSDTPIVTFCTGGIRCEKAAPYLESLGYRRVLQLYGGILNYFEKVGGAHYRGACWVFDDRVALTPDLKPMAK
jgi:predicted sulfurtransferase